MKTYAVEIRQKLSRDQGLRLSVTPPLPVSAQPGQYYLAFAPGTTQILPVPLFPFSEQVNSLELCGKVQPFWQANTPLLLQGPLGKGFGQCLKANRLAIYSFDRDLEDRLYFLAVHALGRGTDVTWITDSPTLELPPQVEILKTSELCEAIAWSDACAITIPYDQISKLTALNSLKLMDRDKVELMIDTPMTCGNINCGICAVETRHGWKLACKDGPVFLLGEIQNG